VASGVWTEIVALADAFVIAAITTPGGVPGAELLGGWLALTQLSNLPECAPDRHLLIANKVIVTAVCLGWLSLVGDTGPLPFMVGLVTSEHS